MDKNHKMVGIGDRLLSPVQFSNSRAGSSVVCDCSENLKDVVGELFQPCNMPEAPKQNFFKNLFIGAISTTVDREELCS